MAERTTFDVSIVARRRLVGAGLAMAVGMASVLWAPAPAEALFEGGLFSPSGNYLAGRLAGRNRDNATAAEFYSRALRSDPNNPVILERTFLLELSSGRLGAAEKLAHRVIRQDNRNRLARVVLGLKEFKEKRFGKAREHWQAGAHGSIGLLTGSLLTAWSHAGEGDTAKALEALEQLSGTEAFGIYRIFHGALIADLGEDQAKAKELYEKAYATAGSSLRVVQAYGNYLQRNGEQEKAREIYNTYTTASSQHPLIDEVLKQFENDQQPAPLVPDAQKGAAEALFGLASALAEESGVDFAIIFSQMTLDLKPEFPIAVTLLADIYEDAKLYTEAVEIYKRVPKDSPLHMNSEIRTALNLNDLDRLEEAKETLNRLIEAEPERYQPLFTMANILRGHSLFVDASGYYSKALDRLPEVTARHWTVFYFRGICYERAKDWHKAEADFLRALKLRPDQPLVLNYLGYSWVEKRHNLTEAIRMIRKAVELRPNDGYIVDSLGWAHFQLKEFDLAVTQLERAVELRPEDPVINEHLGDAYWQVGRETEAKFQWSHARDFKPEPEVLERIMLKLEHGLLDDKAETQTDQPDKS